MEKHTVFMDWKEPGYLKVAKTTAKFFSFLFLLNLFMVLPDVGYRILFYLLPLNFNQCLRII